MPIQPNQPLLHYHLTEKIGTIDWPNYAVHPDGRFLMLRSEELAAKTDRLSIVHGALPGL